MRSDEANTLSQEDARWTLPQSDEDQGRRGPAQARPDRYDQAAGRHPGRPPHRTGRVVCPVWCQSTGNHPPSHPQAVGGWTVGYPGQRPDQHGQDCQGRGHDLKAKAAKTVHQVTPTVSIAKTGSGLLHADLPATRPDQDRGPSTPAHPCPHSGSSEGPVATGEPRKAPASDNPLSPVLPQRRCNGSQKNRFRCPSPEPRNPVDLSRINLNVPSTGASRGGCND